MAIKQFLKRNLLRKKGIIIDRNSIINYGCKFTGSTTCKIVNSFVHANTIGEGCFIENAVIYGGVDLGRFVSITGPGTIVHKEVNSIQIGSFSSIAPNVSIIEFNHDMSRPTTYSIKYNLFNKMAKDDFVSKGSIIIGEDVWIGANVTILSGVKIGRGAVIAAGAVVNHDVEPYSVYGGIPARKIKMRFSQEEIDTLEADKWWEWSIEEIKKNEKYFSQTKK